MSAAVDSDADQPSSRIGDRHRPPSSADRRDRARDRAVGATAGALICASVAASVALARFTGLPTRIGLVALWAAMAAGAIAVERTVHHRIVGLGVRPPDRPARRRRRRAGAVTFAATLLVGAVTTLLVGWVVVALLPGIVAAGAIAAARHSELSMRPSRPMRWAPLAVVLVAVPAVFSLETALTADSTDPLSIRAVEWLRDNGGAGVVNGTEHWWYTNHAPPVGGTPATVPAAPSAVDRAVALRPLTSPASVPIPGEGQWTVTAGTPAHPAVATTFLRPDPVHTSIVVGIMRIDPALVRMQLVAGTEQPGGAATGTGEVPASDRSSLIAAFNAGFRMKEANGGWFSAGRTAEPLRAGAASLVLRSDGRADVGVWGRDERMDPDVTAVRQNLALVVDGGRLVPGTQDGANLLWGKTLGHKVLVDRSGVGVTADGALVYVGGPGLSVATLGETLIAAGAVRGMELDINTAWVNAYTYAPGPSGPLGTRLIASMVHGPDRYLHVQSRDFVSVESGPPRA